MKLLLLLRILLLLLLLLSLLFIFLVALRRFLQVRFAKKKQTNKKHRIKRQLC